MMKKLLLLTICSIFATAASAHNPFFGEYQNQFSFTAGQGVNSGFLIPPPIEPVPFYLLTVQYSQPTTFFRLPARRSVNIGQTLGFGKKYGWDWDSYITPMIYLTEDVALLHGDRWYLSSGFGVGLQASENERLGAKLLFSFEIAYGYRITEEIGIEAFVHHMSNANTAEENNSYAFYGIGATYNF